MEGSLIVAHQLIPAMDAPSIEKVRELSEKLSSCLNKDMYYTNHMLHAKLDVDGKIVRLYARTLETPPYTLITGTLIKIPTILITCGDISVYIGNGTIRADGPYNIYPASAGRKQAVFSHGTRAFYTMIFPTLAETVEEAERHFTDEYDLLGSHADEKYNSVVITGE